MLCALLATFVVGQAGAPEAPDYEASLVSWALAQVGRELEPNPQGQRVEEVLVVSENIFAKDDLFPPFLNVFHWKTRESVIRREVLLAEGATFELDRAKETERNLRRLPILAVAKVVAVKGKEGGVGVLVVTKDQWSLRLNSEFNLVGTLLRYLHLQGAENNFLGENQQAAVDLELVLDKVWLGEIFVNRRVAGLPLFIGESAKVAFNRASGAPEGVQLNAQVGKPMYTLSDRWGLAVDVRFFKARQRQYRGANVWQLPYAEADGTTSNVPYIYDAKELRGTAAATWSTGTAWKFDLTGAVGGFTLAYTPPSRLGLSDAQSAWLTQNYLPLTQDVFFVAAQARVFEPRFTVLRNVDTFVLSEDTREGLSVTSTVRTALPLAASMARYVELSGTATYRWVFHDNYLSASMAGSVRLWPGVAAFNRRFAWELYEATPPVGGGRFVFRGVGYSQVNDNSNSRTALGGGNGLRGTPADFVTGRNYVLGNFEYRTRAFEFRTVYVGFVLFYDVGSAYDVNPRAVHTVGAGLRILLPQFNRETIRIDFGAVVGGEGLPGFDRMSASFGQVTDYRPDFLSSPFSLLTARGLGGG